MYEFNFQNAWMDSKNGLSRTLAPTSYRIGGPTGGRAPTMPVAEEGKANYVMEIATGRGQDGWVPCTVPHAAGSLRATLTRMWFTCVLWTTTTTRTHLSALPIIQRAFGWVPRGMEA